ncbi:MAG: 30S ribosomal protein S2 [Patescibacteria group bacterium]
MPTLKRGSAADSVSEKDIKEMLDAACHFGHRVERWNPKMRRYLHGKRNGVHIFDLAQTKVALDAACAFLREQASTGKVVLLVCTKLHAAKLIEKTAKAAGMPYVTRKWLPGLLTNYDTIRKRILFLKELKDSERLGGMGKYTKKEMFKLKKTITKLENALGGVQEMLKKPDAVFVADIVRDRNAVREASLLGIPVVGIADSNADPDNVTYPIPGNDDAIKSLKFFVEKIEEALIVKK